MKKEAIQTEDAPAAVGPYSQGIRIGQFVFTAGQIPIDPATGKLIKGDIAHQTERILHNLRAVLLAAGTDLSNIVKTTVFLQDMGDFKAMNEVYGRFFEGAPPARSTVEVSALPLGCKD